MWKSMLLSIFLAVTSGCGAAGSPIAPEDVGLEAKIRKQRQEQKSQSKPNDSENNLTPLEDEPVQLPPLHQVGTR